MSFDSFVIIADKNRFCKPFFAKTVRPGGRRPKTRWEFCLFGRIFKKYLYILDKARALPYYK